LANLEFINESEREFTDISSEESRQYLFHDGMTLEIEHPQFLSVSASQNHYVVDVRGRVYVIPPGWKLLTWQTKPGRAHFVA